MIPAVVDRQAIYIALTLDFLSPSLPGPPSLPTYLPPSICDSVPACKCAVSMLWSMRSSVSLGRWHQCVTGEGGRQGERPSFATYTIDFQ